MTSDRTRIALALFAAWGFVLAAIAATALLVGADSDEAQRRLLADVLAERAASIVVVSLLLLVPLFFVVRALFARCVKAPRRLAEDARIILTANPAHRAPLAGHAEVRRLAEGVNAFADAHEGLRKDVERRVREANAGLEQERNRLAALMSELAQSVVVCNVEGRILLYNARAMQFLRKPLEGDPAGHGPSLVGLGRSVFAIFDRHLIIHALDTIHERLRQGKQSPVAHFVTAAPSGALVRVQMAAVLGKESDAARAEEEVSDPDSILLDQAEAALPDAFRHYNPTVVDFIRRCDTQQQAEEIICYLLKRGEITAEEATELRTQINKEGLRSLGPKKEEGYYFKESGLC